MNSRTLKTRNTENDVLNKAEVKAVADLAESRKKLTDAEAKEVRKRLFGLS